MKAFFGLLLATKITYCWTIIKNVVFGENKTFKGTTKVFHNSYINVLQCLMVLNWQQKSLWFGKNFFSMSIVIPHKSRYSNECSKDVYCDRCDNLVNQTKEFLAFFNYLKRKAVDANGCRLPWYKDHLNDGGEYWALRYIIWSILNKINKGKTKFCYCC